MCEEFSTDARQKVDATSKKNRNFAEEVFAPWASDASAQRDVEERLALLCQAVAASEERPPSEVERGAMAWLAARDDKVAGHCRQLLAALLLPYPQQRQADAAAALKRIRRHLGYGGA